MKSIANSIDELNSGIYSMSWPNTGNLYVGSTAKTFKLRWGVHLIKLKLKNLT